MFSSSFVYHATDMAARKWLTVSSAIWLLHLIIRKYSKYPNYIARRKANICDKSYSTTSGILELPTYLTSPYN